MPPITACSSLALGGRHQDAPQTSTNTLQKDSIAAVLNPSSVFAANLPQPHLNQNGHCSPLFYSELTIAILTDNMVLLTRIAQYNRCRRGQRLLCSVPRRKPAESPRTCFGARSCLFPFLWCLFPGRTLHRRRLSASAAMQYRDSRAFWTAGGRCEQSRLSSLHMSFRGRMVRTTSLRASVAVGKSGYTAVLWREARLHLCLRRQTTLCCCCRRQNEIFSTPTFISPLQQVDLACVN